MTSLDLLFMTGAVYGLAWLLTKSQLLSSARELIGSRYPFLRPLLSCIVCTSVWVCVAVLVVEPYASTINISPMIADVPLLLGWTMGATWLLAKLTRDAD